MDLVDLDKVLDEFEASESHVEKPDVDSVVAKFKVTKPKPLEEKRESPPPVKRAEQNGCEIPQTVENGSTELKKTVIQSSENMLEDETNKYEKERAGTLDSDEEETRMEEVYFGRNEETKPTSTASPVSETKTDFNPPDLLIDLSSASQTFDVDDSTKTLKPSDNQHGATSDAQVDLLDGLEIDEPTGEKLVSPIKPEQSANADRTVENEEVTPSKIEEGAIAVVPKEKEDHVEQEEPPCAVVNENIEETVGDKTAEIMQEDLIEEDENPGILEQMFAPVIGFNNLNDDDDVSESEFEQYLSSYSSAVGANATEPDDTFEQSKSEGIPLSEELAEFEFKAQASIEVETILPNSQHKIPSKLIDNVGPKCPNVACPSTELQELVQRNSHMDNDLEVPEVLNLEESAVKGPTTGNQDMQINDESVLDLGDDTPNEELDVLVVGEDVTCPNTDNGSIPSLPTQNNNLRPVNQTTDQQHHPVIQSSSPRQLATVATTDEVGLTYRPTESELQLGKSAPVWIPDNDTHVCMLCVAKFNVIKRRHHCRACGRVLCGECCNLKAKLTYLDNKEVRICNSCSEQLKKIETYEKQQNAATNADMQEATPSAAVVAATVPPDPSSSSSPALMVPVGAAVATSADQAQSPGPPDPVASVPSTTASVNVSPVKVPSTAAAAPVVGVLKRNFSKREPKQVMFSDGIKPGGDLSESPSSSVSTPSQPPETSTVLNYKSPVVSTMSLSPRQRELLCMLPEGGTSSFAIIVNGQIQQIDEESLKRRFEEGDAVLFAVKKNLSVRVKLVDLDCCLLSKVWCFASNGLRNVAQDELLIVIGGSEGSQMPPLDVLRYLNALYEDILKGKPMSDMSYGVASQLGIHSPDGFLGSKDNAGFLHTRPTYQCLQKLCLPEDPFLIGILIQKIETPWAKVLPLRLALRLGAEYKCKSYPWSFLSDPNRKPVVSEVGHTIMSVLNDFRNFTYNIAHLAGSWVTLEEEKTVINVPSEQYNQVSKILSSSNEHVLAWATSFCIKADSHLVCVQQGDTGSYLTQTINREGYSRRVTGGCFVIFNASLKPGGPSVRSSIVEDGVMIQVRPEMMEQIRDKLNRQQNFKLENEPSASPSNNQPCSIEIRWGPMVQSKLKILSSVDGRSLSDAPRYRLYGKVVEVLNAQWLIRLVALFILPNDNGTIPSEPDDLHSTVKRISVAVGSALLSHSAQLNESGLGTIGVRFTLGSDMMEYSMGANGQPLPENLQPLMDDCMIPILHNKVGDGRQSLKVELTLRLLNL